jgi:hypothetical protein
MIVKKMYLNNLNSYLFKLSMNMVPLIRNYYQLNFSLFLEYILYHSFKAN